METKDKYKFNLAVIAMLSAILISFIALFIPPHGIIDSSVLWFTAQLLVFTATLLGLKMEKSHFENIYNKH